MSENVTNTNVEEVKKEEENTPYTIDVAPMPFDVQTEGRITSTVDLKSLIGQMFSASFNDYVGCKIYVFDGSVMLPAEISRFMTPGSLYVDLYFEKNNNKTRNGILDNLEAPQEKSGSNLERMARVCEDRHARMWYLTKETKEALMEFLPGSYVKGFNPRWDLRAVEETNGNAYNVQQTVCTHVIGLDLNAVVAKIYGTREDPNDPKSKVIYDYQCVPLARSNKGATSYMMQPTQTEFVIQILRNSLSIIGATQDALGYYMASNTTSGFTRYRA